MAKVYTASSQIIKRIILRHLEHPVSILSLFKRYLAHERGVAITKDFPVVFLVLFFGHYGIVSLNLDPVITNPEHALQSVRWVLFIFFSTEIFQVRAIGMASPELLQLVENCPTGAETLIARILNIITDKGSVIIYFFEIKLHFNL